jgi:uncharacterized protein YcnI
MRVKPIVMACAAFAAALAASAPVTAHVSVWPRTAEQGSYARLAFRIPNERDATSCVKVEISFPTDKGLVAVRVHPHAGWTHVMEKARLARPIKTGTSEITETVSKIIWTAQTGAAIQPGEFEEFDVTVGPLPSDVGMVEFAALQTYSDGEIVRWVEPVVAGKEPPDLPAAALTLTRPGDDSTAPASRDDVKSARNLGIAGLVAGLLGLLAGAGALVRRSSPPAGVPKGDGDGQA